jgi:hypothetical protein
VERVNARDDSYVYLLVSLIAKYRVKGRLGRLGRLGGGWGRLGHLWRGTEGNLGGGGVNFYRRRDDAYCGVNLWDGELLINHNEAAIGHQVSRGMVIGIIRQALALALVVLVVLAVLAHNLVIVVVVPAGTLLFAEATDTTTAFAIRAAVSTLCVIVGVRVHL